MHMPTQLLYGCTRGRRWLCKEVSVDEVKQSLSLVRGTATVEALVNKTVAKL